MGSQRRIEPYTWLGTGAVALGIGAAALTLGSGVAQAEDDAGSRLSAGSSQSSDSASAKSRKPASRAALAGPARGPESKVVGSTVTPPLTKAVTTSRRDDAPTKTTVAASARAAAAPKISVVDSYVLKDGANTLAVSPDGKYVYVPVGTTLQIVNTKTNAITNVEIPYAANDIATAGGYVVTVSGSASGNKMTVINASTKKVVSSYSVPVGNSLQDVALSDDGRTAYVFSHNGMMGVVDTTTGEVTKTIPVGAYLHSGTAVDIHGTKIYIARDDSPNGKSLSVVDLVTGTVTEHVMPVYVGASVAVSPDGTVIYTTESGGRHIAAVHADSMDLIDSVDVDPDYTGPLSAKNLVVSADGHYVFAVFSALGTGYQNAGRLYVIDTTTLDVVDQVAVDGRPSKIAITHDGHYLYLAAGASTDNPATLYAISTAASGVDIAKTIGGLKNVLTVIGVFDKIEKALNNLPTVWNLGALLRVETLREGVTDFMTGVTKGDVGLVLSGTADILTALLPKPAAAALEIAKAVIAIVLPISEEDQAAFMEFRAKCMFHKASDQLSPSEAQGLVDRYSGPAALINVPADYARYNVGSWFGSPSC